MRKDDYSMRYYLANLICFIAIYVSCIWGVFKVSNIWLVRVVCMVILFFGCSRIELKYLCYYINYLVTLSLPKEIREKEMELLKTSRRNDKGENR